MFSYEIKDSEFENIRKIMYRKTGVYLRDTKKPLVVSRLRKRLSELNLKNFGEYIKLLEQPGSSEIEIFINAITTNETFFFRHKKQFDILKEKIFPEFLENGKYSITIWSAASSTGEEPYSLAIFCSEFNWKEKNLNCRIYATDINSEVLEFAKKGIYSERSLKETDESLIKKYFIKKSKDAIGRDTYEISDEIKKKVVFFKHNLMEPFSLVKKVDIIFLRNVLIYFNKESKEKVVRLMYDKLNNGGYLIVSLSESLSDVPNDFKFYQFGVYKKAVDE